MLLTCSYSVYSIMTEAPYIHVWVFRVCICGSHPSALPSLWSWAHQTSPGSPHANRPACCGRSPGASWPSPPPRWLTAAPGCRRRRGAHGGPGPSTLDKHITMHRWIQKCMSQCNITKLSPRFSKVWCSSTVCLSKTNNLKIHITWMWNHCVCVYDNDDGIQIQAISRQILEVTLQWG